jgi:tripartite-type tricarboxylate transporter receptor subunit TctC
MVGGTPNVMVANPSIPVADLKGLLDYARNSAGKLS